MSLDISSLYVMAILVAALLGGLLLYFGRHERMAALYWWGTAYLLGALAIAIWSLLGPAFGMIGSGAAGAIGIFACTMIWNAARVFHGRAPTWWAAGIGIAVWLLASVSLPAASVGLRLATGAMIVSLFAGLASGELWSERRRNMRGRWPALAVPVLHGSVLLLPVLVGDILSGDTSPTRAATIFAIELVLYAIGTVFVIFMMVSERSVSVHKVAAQTDPLTGLMNRRGFSDSANALMARQAQLNRPVSVLVFDIDRFKSINDRFGHAAGDEILKMFAATMTDTLRTNDLSGRLGGEEFAALLPCSVEDAAVAAERVRRAFASSDIAIDDVTVDTTVSIGIAGGENADLATLLVAADVALYSAKSNGRNRVEIGNIAAQPDDAAPVAPMPSVVRRAPAMQQFPV